MGYISTSLEYDVALDFAFAKTNNNKIPVVYEIDFKDNKGLFKLGHGYSAYPEENEVLLQDGLEYIITSN